jgi:hypothetical protein
VAVSSNLNGARSFAVQPKNISAERPSATSNLKLPKLRFLIQVSRLANRATAPIKMPANVCLDAFFLIRTAKTSVP